MSQPIQLSILVPSVFDRAGEHASKLALKLAKQAENQPVEVLWFTDNRQRTLGLKRRNLANLAQGKFITHIDDDDDVSHDFVTEILAAIAKNPECDVVVYNQQAVLNDGNPFIVRCGIEYEIQQTTQKDDVWQDITRKPWHWCTWRAEFAKQAKYEDETLAEDWHWVQQLRPLITNQVRIDKVLHHYIFNSKTTLC